MMYRRISLIAVLTCGLAALGFGQQVSSLSVSPSTVTVGASSTGTVKISKAAPAAGFKVNLTSSSAAAASVPASVTVQSGATTASFQITTSAVSAATKVNIIAKDPAGKSAKATLQVNVPASRLTTFTITPASVSVGQTATGTVKLTANAPTGGLVVQLNNTQTFLNVPTSITVPAGSKSATVSIKASFVSAKQTASITATDPVGYHASASVTVTPPNVRLSTVTLSPNPVISDNPTTGTVTLTSPAPQGGLLVNLSSVQQYVTVPANVTVKAGSKTGTFTVTTKSVSVSSTAVIKAQDANGYSASGTVTVKPPTVFLTGVTIAPNTVFGGAGATGSVNLSADAPTAGFAVTLSTMSNAITIPMNVTVSSGENSANFSITTGSVNASTTAIVNAQDQFGFTASASITVNPVVGISLTNSRTYSPQVFTAAAGTTVVFSNTSFMGHTVTSDTGVSGLNSGNIDAGATFSWTIPANAQSGTKFYYHCEYHGSAGNGSAMGAGMAGVIIVQ